MATYRDDAARLSPSPLAKGWEVTGTSKCREQTKVEVLEAELAAIASRRPAPTFLPEDLASEVLEGTGRLLLSRPASPTSATTAMEMIDLMNSSFGA